MTILTSTDRDILAGNGVADAFPFTFPILVSSDMLVTLVDEDGTQTVQTENVDYTVSGAGDESGGTVTFTTPPGPGVTVLLQRNVPFTQPTDYKNQGSFYPRTHERSFDRLTMLVQQLRGQIDRALQLAAYIDGVSTVLPDPQALRLIGWNATENGLRNFTAADIGTSLAFSNFIADTFTALPSQDEFTLTADPGVLANLDVSVDGVTLLPTTEYTYSGTTLTLATPLSGGEKVLARYGTALPVQGGDFLPLSGTSPGAPMTGGIAFSADWSLLANTSDGSDTLRVIIGAGGSPGLARGGFIRLSGNEHATMPAEAVMAAGQGGKARVRASREFGSVDGEVALETEQAVVEQTSTGLYGYARLALRHTSVVRGGISADTSGDVEVYGSGGSARLRPNGVGDSTGEFEVDAVGNAVAAAGVFDVEGNVRRVPINTQNSNYTFALTDLGKVVRKDGASAIAYTINPEGTTAYGDGFIVTVRNANAAGNITLTRGSGVVLREATNGTDANVVVPPWGVKTLVREASNVWVAL